MSAPSVSDILTRQFYEWEMWGRGWFVHGEPVKVEPPFVPFRGHFIPEDIFPDDGIEESAFSSLAKKIGSIFGSVASPQQLAEEEVRVPAVISGRRKLFEIAISLRRDDDPSVDIFRHLLLTVIHCREQLAFEIIAERDSITVQFTCAEDDLNVFSPQLKAHFPDAMFVPANSALSERWERHSAGHIEVREFGLEQEFFLPLLDQGQLAIDPLASICGALDHLAAEEIAVFQVLFEPVRNNWATSLLRTVTTTDGEPFFEDAPEMVTFAKEKISAPLFAVVIRAAATTETEGRTWEILKGIAGALEPLSAPRGNRLILLENEGYGDSDHVSDFLNRVTRRFGMILNAEELVAFTHLPSSAVRANRLVRKVKRTNAVPIAPSSGGIILGENEHDGNVVPVVMRLEQRLRHLHILGNSGTGKSTLLLNLICQDIYQNNGVAVLDPHGDLIDDILPYIPEERWDDVVLFDASDDEYPIGFNILSAHSELERTLLASDLVEVFRRLSTSWGDQMRSVLGNAILAFLENSITGTLPELRRFLIEPAFRNGRLTTVTDPEVKYYWEHEFPILKTQSLGPLLTRLDEFLRRKTIRYIVGQKENRLDFGKIMDEGRIFLARLPQGLVGEENSHMLGSLLVSKFHQLAIARQGRDKADRRPFFLYLDEAHHFVTPTLETILSGGRKYGLGLALAHQGVHQLEGAGTVGQSVLSLSGSRICFRVGDADARQLAEGFSHFERTDLQSLENYEVIGRFDRREHDFNLRTIRPPDLDDGAQWRRDYLRYVSRLRYGTPRQDVEAELAASRATSEKSPVDPFAKRTNGTTSKDRAHSSEASTPAEETPVPPQPHHVPTPPGTSGKIFAVRYSAASQPAPVSVRSARPKVTVDGLSAASGSSSLPLNAFRGGKGGPDHQYAQHFIKNLAVAMQFRVEIEFQIEGTRERVDLMLQKGSKRMAIEISCSTPTDYELANIEKCLRANFDLITFISDSQKRSAVRNALTRKLSPQQLTRVQFSSIDNITAVLIDFDARCGASESLVRGRKMKVCYRPMTPAEGERRKQIVSEITARSYRNTRKR